MLFSDAVYRTLSVPGTKIECDAYVPESHRLTDDQVRLIDSSYDAYVLPLANAFRDSFSRALDRLTEVISRLSIPVVVTGVGCQLGMDGDMDDVSDALKESTSRFVAAVLDHSPAIGVRGEVTRRFLLSLGFHDSDVRVIGCPSLLSLDKDIRIRPATVPLTAGSRIAVNFEAGNRSFGTAAAASDDDLVSMYQANERTYPHLVSVFQTIAGAQLVLWGKPVADFPDGTPRSPQDRAWKENRLRFFTNPQPWIDFMRNEDFYLGVRIHGTIASIIAGTPALLLTVDSRTRELAEYHGIPSLPLRTAVRDGRLVAEELRSESDFTQFHQLMPENWMRYHRYLEECGLHHIAESGHANPDYERRLATLHTTPGAQCMSSDDPAGMASRLLWLWQGRPMDHLREMGSYAPEFALAGARPTSPAETIESLRRQVADLQSRCQSQETALVHAETAQTALLERMDGLDRSLEQIRHPDGTASFLRNSSEQLRRLGRRIVRVLSAHLFPG